MVGANRCLQRQELHLKSCSAPCGAVATHTCTAPDAYLSPPASITHTCLLPCSHLVPVLLQRRLVLKVGSPCRQPPSLGIDVEGAVNAVHACRGQGTVRPCAGSGRRLGLPLAPTPPPAPCPAPPPSPPFDAAVT